jgi:hypothetical protein
MILGIDANVFWAVALMPVVAVTVVGLGLMMVVRMISGGK